MGDDHQVLILNLVRSNSNPSYSSTQEALPLDIYLHNYDGLYENGHLKLT
jgi:hypothetical protein